MFFYIAAGLASPPESHYDSLLVTVGSSLALHFTKLFPPTFVNPEDVFVVIAHLSPPSLSKHK
jgi:hypothetical protein